MICHYRLWCFAREDLFKEQLRKKSEKKKKGAAQRGRAVTGSRPPPWTLSDSEPTLLPLTGVLGPDLLQPSLEGRPRTLWFMWGSVGVFLKDVPDLGEPAASKHILQLRQHASLS